MKRDLIRTLPIILLVVLMAIVAIVGTSFLSGCGAEPAADAGLKEGDIITEFQGKEMTSETDMILVLRDLKSGDQAPVTLDRNGEEVNVTVTVGERSTSTT